MKDDFFVFDLSKIIVITKDIYVIRRPDACMENAFAILVMRVTGFIA